MTTNNTVVKIRNPASKIQSMQRDRSPLNYSIHVETSKLAHPNETKVKQNSLTFLASTGEHFNSILFTELSNRSKIYSYEIYESQLDNGYLRVIMNYLIDFQVKLIDFDTNGLTFLTNSTSINLRPFRYEDFVDHYDHGGNAIFYYVNPTRQNGLAYAIKPSHSNISFPYFRKSILRLDKVPINTLNTGGDF